MAIVTAPKYADPTRMGMLNQGGKLTWNQLVALSSVKLALRADKGVLADAAAQFTAANKEYLQITHASQSGLDLSTTDFSMTAWVYRDATGATHVIFSKSQDANTRWLLFVSNADDLLYLQVRKSGIDIEVKSTSTLSASTWYHVAVVVDRDSAADTKLYLNGVDDTSGTPTVDTQNHDNTGDFELGRYSVSPAGNYMDGRLDSAAIWTGGRLLTAAEVTWLYNSGKGRIWNDIEAGEGDGANLNDANLKAWWDLGEADGATRADSKGSNDLTPVGDELITNGGFATDTDWTKGAGWTIDTAGDGKAVCTNGNGTLDQALAGGSPVAGVTYTTIFTVEAHSGGPFVFSLKGTNGALRSSVATFTEDLVAGSTSEDVRIATPQANPTGDVDDISLKVKNPVTRVQGIQSTFQIDNDGDAVGTWLDQTTNANDFAQTTISKRPLWKANIFGTNPGVLFDGVDDLVTIASAFLTGDKGAVFALIRPTDVTGNQAILVASQTGVGTDYVDLRMKTNGINTKHLAASSEDQVDGAIILAGGNDYIMGWLSDGASYYLRVNKVADSITVAQGTDSGDWMDDPTGLDFVAVGAGSFATEVEQFAGHLGALLVFDGVYPTNSQIRAAEKALTTYKDGGSL